MHTFAQKPKTTQRTNSTISTIPRRSHFGQSLEVNSILHLQRTIGNQAVLRLLQSKTEDLNASPASIISTKFSYDFSQIPTHATRHSNIQLKLKVGTPEDKYEQEADRVAEQVMSMPDGQFNAPTESAIQRKTVVEDENSIRLKSIPGQTQQVSQSLAARINRLRGGGQPLTPSTRTFFEPRFGYDFSKVRVHTAGNAAETARVLNARAFTIGKDIVFGARQYSPATSEGRRLLAHELTHVVQQTGTPLHRSAGIAQPSEPMHTTNSIYPGSLQKPVLISSLGGLRLQRTWDQIADSLLQTPPASAVRTRIVQALADQMRLTGAPEADWQQEVLSRGTRIQVNPATRPPQARYNAINRTIEISENAPRSAIADALAHAIMDAREDPLPPGPLQAQDEAERQARDRIITSMVRDMSPTPARGVRHLPAGGGTELNLWEHIRIAFRAFSLSQLQALDRAGVRIWRMDAAGNLPPGYDVARCGQQPPLSCVQSSLAPQGRIPVVWSRGGAYYAAPWRLILLRLLDDQLNYVYIRHELAHAWDDIRGTSPPRLDQLNDAARRRAIQQVAEQAAEYRRGHIFYSSRPDTGLLRMFRLYEQRLPVGPQRDDMTFDGAEHRGHSLDGVREFYASGFTTFHTGRQENLGRMLWYACELFDFLATEASGAGRTYPAARSRAAVEAYVRSNSGRWPRRGGGCQ